MVNPNNVRMKKCQDFRNATTDTVAKAAAATGGNHGTGRSEPPMLRVHSAE